MDKAGRLNKYEKNERDQRWWDWMHRNAEDSPEQEIIERVYVESLLASLPVRLQCILRLIYWEGYTQRQVARHTWSGHGSRYTRLTRSMISKYHRQAMRYLREAITNETTNQDRIEDLGSAGRDSRRA